MGAWAGNLLIALLPGNLGRGFDILALHTFPFQQGLYLQKQKLRFSDKGPVCCVIYHYQLTHFIAMRP